MNILNPLVVIVDNEPLASTDIIAKGMKQQHKSVLALVRKYIEPLEMFGGVRFEKRPFETRGGRQVREIALLNEQQTALLISMMRNTEKVVDFKVSLIKEFYNMKSALNYRASNLWQQMHALIAQEVESKVKASFGSHLMLSRKREIPFFRDEFDRLEHEIQPDLLN